MSWTSIHAQIHRTIRHRHLLPPKQRLLVAVSGGQDSLCLIKLLLDIQHKWQWFIAIAHCDHRWREDSQDNALAVQSLAESWQVPYHLSTAKETINTEASARDWRYQALTEIAQINQYSHIITGHTASDRAETLLYNLMRGTGADGLQALTWKRSITQDIFLIRPLLEITRSQTAEFCQKFHLPIWEDSTNQNLHYCRNRIRQQLIPYLQSNFNPKVEANLARTAELLQAEVAYLEEIAHQWRLKASPIGENSNFRLNRRILQKAPLAIQRRVMRQVLQEILPESSNFEHIEKLTALIVAPNRTQTDPFPGGAIAQVQDDWIIII